MPLAPMEPETSEAWRDLPRIADDGSQQQLTEFLDHLPDGDVALALSRLTGEQQSQVLTALPPEEAADLVEQLSDAQAVELIEVLQPESAAAILNELPSCEQADLIADLNQAGAEAILEQMDPAEAADARALSQYDDEVAGGLMVTEFLKYREDAAVGDVVDDMRQRADEYRDYDVQYAYICDKAGRLTG